MTTTYDPLVWIPVIRAEAYPGAWPADRFPTPRGFPIIDLYIRFLVVDTMVFERLVTLAASTNNSGIDDYGFEFDMSSTDARALGRQLMAAADEAEV